MRSARLLAAGAWLSLALLPAHAAGGTALEPVEGAWSARVGWGGETLRLRMRWTPASGGGENRADFEIPLEEFQGLVPGDFSRSGAPLEFSWKRETGTIRFTGEGAWFFRPGGSFRFLPDPGAAAQLRELETLDVDSRTLFWMALRDLDPALLRGLGGLGYRGVRIEDVARLTRRGIGLQEIQEAQFLEDRPSLEEIVRLHSRGILGPYLGAFKENGIREITVEGLIRLHARGIDAGTVRAMGDAGYGLDRLEEILQLQARGVGPETVAGFADIGRLALNTEEIVRLHDRGIRPGEAAGYAAVEHPALATGEIIRLHDRGIGPGLVASYAAVKEVRPGAGEIIRLQLHNVPPGYLRSAAAAGLREPVESAIRLHQRGVEPELLTGLARLGYTGVDEISTVHSRGIPLREIQELHGLGYGHLDVDDLARLHGQGIGAAFVKRLVEAGYTRLSAEELVRIKRRGREELPIRRSRP